MPTREEIKREIKKSVIKEIEESSTAQKVFAKCTSLVSTRFTQHWSIQRAIDWAMLRTYSSGKEVGFIFDVTTHQIRSGIYEGDEASIIFGQLGPGESVFHTHPGTPEEPTMFSGQDLITMLANRNDTEMLLGAPMAGDLLSLKAQVNRVKWDPQEAYRRYQLAETTDPTPHQFVKPEDQLDSRLVRIVPPELKAHLQGIDQMVDEKLDELEQGNPQQGRKKR